MSEELISFKGYSYKCFDCSIPLPKKSVKEFTTADNKIIYLCSKCYNERLPDLCPICNCFKKSEFYNIIGFKGWCHTSKSKQGIPITLKRTACDDFVGVIPKIEVVVQNE